jgi:site-specific recombinase XerC
MEQFITWYCSEPRLALNRAVVLRFRLHLESLGLAAGTINQRLAAVRRLAYEASDSGLLSPELAAGIRRVKGVKQLGSRLGNWLSSDQAKLLLEKADGEDLRSIRDLAMMSVLLGCGLRRAELSALEVEDIEVQARTLGHCRPDWQRQPCEDRAHAHVGQRSGRSLDHGG